MNKIWHTVAWQMERKWEPCWSYVLCVDKLQGQKKYHLLMILHCVRHVKTVLTLAFVWIQVNSFLPISILYLFFVIYVQLTLYSCSVLFLGEVSVHRSVEHLFLMSRKSHVSPPFTLLEHAPINKGGKTKATIYMTALWPAVLDKQQYILCRDAIILYHLLQCARVKWMLKPCSYVVLEKKFRLGVLTFTILMW